MEIRVPFLDRRVVEAGLSLPYRLKLKGVRGTKYVLRSAYRDILPRSILMRKKMGFSLPVSGLFKRELKDVLLSFTKNEYAAGYLNINYIRKLLDEHLKGNANNRKMLWNILIFLIWCRNNEIK